MARVRSSRSCFGPGWVRSWGPDPAGPILGPHRAGIALRIFIEPSGPVNSCVRPRSRFLILFEDAAEDPLFKGFRMRVRRSRHRSTPAGSISTTLKVKYRAGRDSGR